MTTLLVAISGGHLTQLRMLAPRVVDGGDVVWMTNDTPQSRSLLAGEKVYHVPTRAPRDYAGVLRDTRIAHRVLTENRVDRVVSTGAQIALSALAPAMARGIPFVYIESATRVTDISATGRVMQRMPGVRRYVQYPAAATGKWRFALSVFDGFDVEPVEPSDRAGDIGRAVVTVGGNGDYGFRRLIDAARAALPPGAEVLWQVGSTDVSDLDIAARTSLPSAELTQAMRDADVVIGHAGTGTALSALAAGRIPIVSPRSVAHGEHVDGHQHDLAAFLADRGLAIVREPDQLTRDDLDLARRWRAVRRHDQERVSL